MWPPEIWEFVGPSRPPSPGFTCSPAHFFPFFLLRFAFHRPVTMTKNLMPQTMLLYAGCSLLILSASLAGASLAEMVFRCPGCTAERQALCPKLTETCAEIVREPGCGCCPVCARAEGEMCGVYTPRCATGLRCYPTPNSELPLEQLVQGQGLCRRKVDTEAATCSQEQREQTSGQCGSLLFFYQFLMTLSRLQHEGLNYCFVMKAEPKSVSVMFCRCAPENT